MATMITVGSTALTPNPSQVSVDVYDLDDGATTTRTMDGLLHRDRIAVKRKLSMSWDLLTGAQLSDILSAMSATFFNVTYPDPLTNSNQTKTFYVGDRSNPVGVVSPAGAVLWQGISFNLIER